MTHNKTRDIMEDDFKTALRQISEDLKANPDQLEYYLRQMYHQGFNDGVAQKSLIASVFDGLI